MSMIDDLIRDIQEYVTAMGGTGYLEFKSYELNHQKGFKLDPTLHREPHKIKAKEPFKRLVRKINMGAK